MVFTKTGIVNSDKSILYVEKIKEEFFDIYSFEYNEQRVVVTGKKDGGSVHAKINVEGVGLVPVCIKKGKPALLLAEGLAKKYDSRVITESNIQKTKQPKPVVLVEQQKQEILEHIDEELSKYKDKLDFFTENATQFVESKVREHGSSLLKEYLKTVDKLKPTFENLITENFRNHISNIDNYLTSKISNLDNRVIEHLNSNNQFKLDVNSAIEESKIVQEQLLLDSIESFNKKLTESKEAYDQFKSKLTDYLAATKETSEELTSNTLKNIQEKVDLCLKNTKQESTELALVEAKNALDGIKNDLSVIHEKNKTDLFNFNQKNFENSLLKINDILKEEKQNLVEFHNQKIQDLNKLTQEKENEVSQSLEKISEFLSEERKKVFGLYKDQIQNFSKEVKNSTNEFKKMFSSLKEDVTKSVLTSVNKELLEEKRDNKSNLIMSDIRGLKSRLDAMYIQLRREIADVGGGGGNTAVQFADGGEMRGTLNVTNGGDYLSAGKDLSEIYLRIDEIQNITTQQAQNIMTTLESGDLNLDRRGSSMTFNQASPLSAWVINHNFGYIPTVLIVDSEGDEVEGQIIHNTGYTTLTAIFKLGDEGWPTAGTAYLD